MCIYIYIYIYVWIHIYIYIYSADCHDQQEGESGLLLNQGGHRSERVTYDGKFTTYYILYTIYYILYTICYILYAMYYVLYAIYCSLLSYTIVFTLGRVLRPIFKLRLYYD